MALFKVMEEAATGGTHKVVDGTFVDLINPLSLPGDTTTAFMRAGAYALAGWVGRGYRDNKSFSL